MRPVGVIGPLAVDVVAGGEPRIGGGPWHAARALHTLRHDAIIIAKCGEARHRDFQRRLASLGLPTAVSVGKLQTGFSFSYDENGARTMHVDSIGDPLVADDVPAPFLRRADFLHVVPLLRGDVDRHLLARLARGHRLALDGQGLVRERRVGPLELSAEFDRGLLEHVSVLKVAEEEAAAIGDVSSLGVPELIVTAGARGARVIAGARNEHVPARYVAADPTGAGDAFAVAYLAARSDGHAPTSAARSATALVGALLAGNVR